MLMVLLATRGLVASLPISNCRKIRSVREREEGRGKGEGRGGGAKMLYVK